MKNELYRRLAADGNKHAKHLADELGAMPGEEMDDANSEEQEANELAELTGKVEGMKAKAKAHAESGDHAKAADAHEERALFHDARGEHKEAADAFKDALASHKAGACWGTAK
jgi:rubrerythrin